jgi:glutaredoxin
VRDYLHSHSVEFDERNIRQSDKARDELRALTGSLVVPTLVAGDQRIVGFDPDALATFVTEREGRT